MENNIIKLGDFGTSKNISPYHRTKTLAGSPLYSAPELLKQLEAIENNEEDKIKNLSYSYEVDIWSLGVTFLHIMSLEKPFDKNEDIELLNKLEKANLVYPFLQNIFYLYNYFLFFSQNPLEEHTQ